MLNPGDVQYDQVPKWIAHLDENSDTGTVTIYGENGAVLVFEAVSDGININGKKYYDSVYIDMEIANLQNQINNLMSLVGQLRTDLTDETTARTNEDSAIRTWATSSFEPKA